MSKSEPNVSIWYDQKQDRLRLLVCTAEQEQKEAVLTRRLFKAMLKELPDWLAKQSTVSNAQNVGGDLVTDVQKHAINQFQHQVVHQQVQASRHIVINKKTESFVINEVKMSAASKKNGEKGVSMCFESEDKAQTLTLTMGINRFHMVIACMLREGDDWGLVNPCCVDSNANSSRLMH